jgi:hypothetical protein
MGLLRNRGLEGTRYTMREKMFSIGDDFWKAPSRSLAPAKVGICQSGAEAAFRRPW